MRTLMRLPAAKISCMRSSGKSAPEAIMKSILATSSGSGPVAGIATSCTHKQAQVRELAHI